MNMAENEIYELPMVEIVEIEVEGGFAVSTGVEDPVEDELQGW